MKWLTGHCYTYYSHYPKCSSLGNSFKVILGNSTKQEALFSHSQAQVLSQVCRETGLICSVHIMLTDPCIPILPARNSSCLKEKAEY